jgi:lincosamide nucleotidyltransferase A/C/D/E
MADDGLMTESEVLAVLDALFRAGVKARVAGGWAVDAVVGETTRAHRDLDLAIRTEDVDRAISTVGALGYAVSLDLRPVRLVLAAPRGRRLDIHPVAFDASGFGRQAGDDGRVFGYLPEGFGNRDDRRRRRPVPHGRAARPIPPWI